MVLIRQRAPASPGRPVMHTPAQQGLEEAELPGSFSDQASPTYFWAAGSCLAGVDSGGAGRSLPGPGSAGLALPHAPNSSPIAGACLPLLGSHTHGWPEVS